MWMIILQSCDGIVVRDEWGTNKPDKGDIEYTEHYYSNELGQPMVAVNIYFVEE